MRTKETTLTQMSGVEATQKRGRVWLDFFFLNLNFFYFSIKVMDNREFYFNKILLSSLPFCFILQSNH